MARSVILNRLRLTQMSSSTLRNKSANRTRRSQRCTRLKFAPQGGDRSGFSPGAGRRSTPVAQAYLLDFTVASVNPEVFISYAGSFPPGPPLVESNLKVIDLSRMDDLSRQPSPTITPPNKILNFQTGRWSIIFHMFRRLPMYGCLAAYPLRVP